MVFSTRNMVLCFWIRLIIGGWQGFFRWSSLHQTSSMQTRNQHSWHIKMSGKMRLITAWLNTFYLPPINGQVPPGLSLKLNCVSLYQVTPQFCFEGLASKRWRIKHLFCIVPRGRTRTSGARSKFSLRKNALKVTVKISFPLGRK